jgi:Uma2 family endonuclease
MNPATAEKFLSEEEYLAFEEKSKIRHEYLDDEIFAIAGATRKHNLATTNISTELSLQLREKDCEVYSIDFHVKVRGGHHVYPDVAAVCGDIQTTDNDKTLLDNFLK